MTDEDCDRVARKVTIQVVIALVAFHLARTVVTWALSQDS